MGAIVREVASKDEIEFVVVVVLDAGGVDRRRMNGEERGRLTRSGVG